MNYESSAEIQSTVIPGVTFVVSKMSVGRRLDLIRRIRELLLRHEFLDGGSSPTEKLEAACISAEIDRLYVEWGLQKLAGIDVDGVPATPEILVSHGPENLYREIVTAVKSQCELSDGERKN